MDGTPFGRYRLVELLGRGGMGEVWRAYDTETRRTVAIKLLPASFASDPVFAERFRREAYAAAGLNDPHVVPIHQFGEIEGRLYVDMRLVEGRDLAQILADGPLQPTRAVRIVQQVAEALAAAHRVRLIHRDVKPSNVLVADNDFAYLIDFGIARASDETSLTNSGQAIGTPDYMAPERLNPHLGDEDHRVDVYALSCILYQCLTGQRPFQGVGFAQIATAQLFAPPPRPSERLAGLPAAMDDVIATGMAKNPRERFTGPIELADAARRALTTEAPKPPPSAHDVTRPVFHEAPNQQAAVSFPNTKAAPWPEQYSPRQYLPAAPGPPPPAMVGHPGRPSRRAPILVGVAVVGVIAVVVATLVVLVNRSGDPAQVDGRPTSPRPAETTTTTDVASLLASAVQNTVALTSVHVRMTVTGTIEGLPLNSLDGDMTSTPDPASKGTMNLVLMGQTLSDVGYVVVGGQFYAALTPNSWSNFGPAAGIFDASALLGPTTGLGVLLTAFTKTGVGTGEVVDNQSTERIEGTVSAAAVNAVFPAVKANSPVPAVVWIDPTNQRLVQVQLMPTGTSSITMTQSDWDEPVVVTKPPGV